MNTNGSLLRALARVAATAAIAALAMAGGHALAQSKVATAKPAAKAFDASACLACHAPVKAFYDSGKHKTVGCNACHDGTAEHLSDSTKRPVTKTDLATCGGCHANQYKSYAHDGLEPHARASRRSR